MKIWVLSQAFSLFTVLGESKLLSSSITLTFSIFCTPSPWHSTAYFKHTRQEMAWTRSSATPSPIKNISVILFQISGHQLVSSNITLPLLPDINYPYLSLIFQNLHSVASFSVAICTLSTLPDPKSFPSQQLELATNTFWSSLSSSMEVFFLCCLGIGCIVQQYERIERS